MTVQVDVQHACDVEGVPAADDLVDWVMRVVEATACLSTAEISVRVVDEAEMRQLNHDFRGQDKPTNVLSFRTGDLGGLPELAGLLLGDIVICSTVVADEALKQGKRLKDHWAHMVVHGTLHLLGFDHDNDSDAAVMEGFEIQIMTDHGIANPYAESV